MSSTSSESKPVTSTSSCPCGSDLSFGECCEPIILGTSAANGAEALLRSRFTAHVVNDTRYLDSTYLPTSKLPPSGDTVSEDTKWQSLDIHQHDENVRPDVSHIDFTAHFTEKGEPGVMHEKSEFEKIDGAWIFTKVLRRGPAPIVSAPKVGRNELCPCGSGKKYKKCCG